MYLKGKEIKALLDALESAFVDKSEFERFMDFELGVKLSTIGVDAPYVGLKDTCYRTIKWANANGKIKSLIEKANEVKGENPILKKFYQDYSISHEGETDENKEEPLQPPNKAEKMAGFIVILLLVILFSGMIMFGVQRIYYEKEELYNKKIDEIENGADYQAAYDSALVIFGDRIDPYIAMAKRLWENRDIDACRTYIEKNLANIAKFQDVSEASQSFGDIYYILGNCYYLSKEPDYDDAQKNFEIAVRYVKDNPIYYRDYAISLARTNAVTDAELVLEKAQTLNLNADSLNLLHGEIAFVKKEYNNALKYFETVILSASDVYMRYRAYHTSDEIYKLLGQPELSVKLLSGAMNRIPLNCVEEMTERLADAYAKSGDYENAIKLFESLSESGPPQFNIMQNLAILLQKSGEFNRATEVLNKMKDSFPNDYRVPMRRAYLEADMQSKLENYKRDYTLTKQYYDMADPLYREYREKSGKSDPEMQKLDILIEQLRQNGWID